MKTTRVETERKYLAALISLKKRLDNREKLTMAKVASEYRVSKQFTLILVKKGVVKNLGVGRDYCWIWNTREPDERMVKALIKEINSYSKRYNRTRKTATPKLTVNSVRPIENNQLNTKEVVLFWGLITIKINK